MFTQKSIAHVNQETARVQSVQSCAAVRVPTFANICKSLVRWYFRCLFQSLAVYGVAVPARISASLVWNQYSFIDVQ